MVDWKTLPSLSALRAFEAVAQAGDFAGAARALNVTHAAISQQVRGLERELGLVLAQRVGRSVVLSETGRMLAAGLSDGFSTIARTVQDVRDKDAKRTIRVSTTPFIVDAMIMPRLSEFWRLHPEVEVALQPKVAYVDLSAEGYDLGIRAGALGLSWRGLESIVLSESDWLVVGAPSLVTDSEMDPLSLPWVWSDEMPGEIVALEVAGVDIDALNKIDVGASSLHWNAARRGLGLTLASEHVAREDLDAGRLVALPFPGLPTSAYYAAWPKGPQREIVRQFVDWLKMVF